MDVTRLMVAVAVLALTFRGVLWGRDLARLSGENEKKAIEAGQIERDYRSLQKVYPEERSKSENA